MEWEIDLNLLTWLRQEAQRKKMILVIVFLALFLDHMLLSVVVPILPNYLYKIGKAPTTTPGNSTDLTVNPPINQSLNNRSVILGSTSAPPHQTPALSSNPTVAQKFPESNCSYTDAHLDEVNIKVGLLLASKSTIQLIINPFMGPLTDRIGYHIPMCAGFCIIIFSTTLFAFSSSFILLLLARSVQGVGGSCLSVAGMGMLADGYKDGKERGRAMGISFTGLALGLIAGAPFGSVMYEFVGKMAPFLVLAAVAVLAGAKQLHELLLPFAKIHILYFLCFPGAICLTTLVIATIETALPIWMMKTMCASKWQLGTVFLTDSISYLVASNIFGHLSQKYSRSWLCACIGMILAGISTIAFGFSNNIYHVLVLNAIVGFSVGTVDSSIMPLMGNLVDLRYVPVYGTVYAIADVAVCIGFSLGPAIAGPIVKSIGFHWLMAIIGTANIIFSPLCIFLYSPPWQEDHLHQDPMDDSIGLVQSECLDSYQMACHYI
uniref:Solute carrier family 18 member A2 n=1 Tax=Cyclopterus lumpus TaxID=8103 RepID=A0A8C2X0M8_CYCLU